MAYYSDRFDTARALVTAGPLDDRVLRGPGAGLLLVAGGASTDLVERVAPGGRALLPADNAAELGAGAEAALLIGPASTWPVRQLWRLQRSGVRWALATDRGGWRRLPTVGACARAVVSKAIRLPRGLVHRAGSVSRSLLSRAFSTSPTVARLLRLWRGMRSRLLPYRLDERRWRSAAPPPRNAPEGRLRVVLYLGTMNAGGAERQHGNLAVGLKERGHHVRILSALPLEGDAGHYRDQFRDRGITIEVAGSQPAPDVCWRLAAAADPALVASLPATVRGGVLELAGELLRDPPDVLHCTLDQTNIAGLAAGLLIGVPQIVLSTRNINPSNFVFFQGWMQSWYRLAASLPQVRLIANSRHGARDYAAWMGVDPARFSVILNGVDLASLPTPAPEAVGAVRREVRAEPGDPLLAGIFRLSEEKRPFLFLDVVEQVRRALPRLKVALVGVGNLESAVRQAIRRQGLDDAVTLLGRRQDVGAILSASDALLLTSTIEGTPNVVLEAQWFRCPPVATAVGGTPDVVIDGTTGTLAGRDDRGALIAGVVRLLSDPHARRAMGEAGRRHIEQNFSVDGMVEATLALYRMAPAPLPRTAPVAAAQL